MSENALLSAGLGHSQGSVLSTCQSDYLMVPFIRVDVHVRGRCLTGLRTTVRKQENTMQVDQNARSGLILAYYAPR